MENETGGSPPTPQVQEYENGIFNLVVSLTQHLSQQYGPEAAREYVATHLQRLADGLLSIPNAKKDTNNEPRSKEYW